MGTWLKRFSLVALLGFPIAVLGTRLQLWQYGPGLKLVAATFVLSCLVFVASVIVAIWKRQSAPATRKAAMIAAAVSLLPMLGIGTQLAGGSKLPAIHNISTDVTDPPQFVKIALIRNDQHNPLEYNVRELADVQRAAYPNVTTQYTNLSIGQAHDRAMLVAQSLGWDIVHHDVDAGIIEATDTTKLWNFKDDVVIRLRSVDGEIAVDLRSVSRVGRSDLGANAKRIESFFAAFEQ